MVYVRGPYNVMNEAEQWIRISDGCPNGCPFCYCPGDLEFYGIPQIERCLVKILDMNLLSRVGSNPVGSNALEVIKELGSRRVDGKVVYFELICGVDWRFLSWDVALALKKARFLNVRLAWDWGFSDQKKIRAAVDFLAKAGFRRDLLSVFIICNWKVSFEECCRKLDLLKVWGVKVNDCYFDNQTMPNVWPLYWKWEDIKKFRSMCRKHNHLIRFRIDPSVR